MYNVRIKLTSSSEFNLNAIASPFFVPEFNTFPTSNVILRIVFNDVDSFREVACLISVLIDCCKSCS